MATPVLNPTNFTIVDPVASTQGVTGMKIMVGTASGGPYLFNMYNLTAAEIAAGIASGTGTFTGSLASVGENLAPGTYYMVAAAVNATGTGGNSPEVALTVQAVPSPPTSFSVS